MPQRLTDAEVAQIRRLAGELSAAELAARFGCSRRHIGRLLRNEQRQQLAPGLDADLARLSLVAAVERFVGGLEDLDAEGDVLAQTAVSLAVKLDQTRDSTAAASGAAMPALAQRLVEVVARLSGETAEPDALDDLRRRREARRLALFGGAHTEVLTSTERT